MGVCKQYITKLQTFAASDRWHTARLASDVEDNWPLDPRDNEMCTLANCHLLYSSESIKDHRSVTTVHCKTAQTQTLACHIRQLISTSIHKAGTGRCSETDSFRSNKRQSNLFDRKHCRSFYSHTVLYYW